MSLNKKAPQSFAPLRLKSHQLTDFFSQLRDRKLSKGETDSSIKTVSSKPFQSNPPPFEKKSETKDKHSPKRKSKPKAKSKSKKKLKLENRIADVKF